MMKLYVSLSSAPFLVITPAGECILFTKTHKLRQALIIRSVDEVIEMLKTCMTFIAFEIKDTSPCKVMVEGIKSSVVSVRHFFFANSF